MTLLDKLGTRNQELARETSRRGTYPYYRVIQEATPTHVRVEGSWKIMLGSNNYLGLTHHPEVLEASCIAARMYGSGSTGSRLLNGTLALHEELESRLASLFAKEAALVFTTGYQANVGVVASLVGRADHVFLDRLDHASIVDGARLGHGSVHRYPHNDAVALARQLGMLDDSGGCLVATDGVFSMEGTIADLPALVPVTQKHKAVLLLDEAHGLGVLGASGAGTAEYYGLTDQVDLITATFSKSLGSVGGVVAGDAEVIHFLRHHARSLLFTASAPPSSVAAALAALRVMISEPERRERLWSNTRRLAEGLRGLGLLSRDAVTPILPVVIGDVFATTDAWRVLFDAGVYTQMVMPPAVPADQCRLRVSATSEHTDQDIDRVIEAFGQLIKDRSAHEAPAHNDLDCVGHQ